MPVAGIVGRCVRAAPRLLMARSRTPMVAITPRRMYSTVRDESENDTSSFSHAHFSGHEPDDDASTTEHAVISMFDLFSIGIGPSSSHTVGPMRAGAIFVNDLRESGVLPDVARIKLALYGSLAATGKGHMTPQALLLGLEGADCETVDTESVPQRYQSIVNERRLTLGKDTSQYGAVCEIQFDYERDLEARTTRMTDASGNGALLCRCMLTACALVCSTPKATF